MLRLPQNALLLSLVVLHCTVSKGVSENRWDPLPAGVRSVVSSNHLSESPPQVFAEYHALLPNYRGDYGVKSELVDAASREPVYKGADTILLPLYIPQGAVPLVGNGRRERSGKADGIANMRIIRGPSPSVRDSSGASSVNRPTRRVLSPVRRPPLGSRPFPTPPAAYLRTWLQRKNVELSPSTAAEREDNVEEAKRSKQKLLSQMTNLRKRMEVTNKNEDDSESDDEALTTIDNPRGEKRSKEAVRIKKIATRLDDRLGTKSSSTEVVSLFVSTTGTPASSGEEASSTTHSSIDTQNVKEVESTITNNPQNSSTTKATTTTTAASPTTVTSTTVSSTTTPASSTTTSSSSTTSLRTPNRVLKQTSRQPSPNVEDATLKPAVIPVIRRRPIGVPKPIEDIVRTRLKPVFPSRKVDMKPTSEILGTDILKVNGNVTTPRPELSSSTSRPAFSSLRTRSPSPPPHVTQPTSRTPALLSRRREFMRREKQASRQGSQQSHEPKESSESIIDRVLNSAASRNENEELPIKSNVSSNSEVKDNNAKINRTLDSTQNHSKNFARSNRNSSSFELSNSEDNIKIPIPPLLRQTSQTLNPTVNSFRQKVPLRLRRPIVSHPIKTVSSTTQSTTTTNTNPSASTTTSTSSTTTSATILKTTTTTPRTTTSAIPTTSELSLRITTTESPKEKVEFKRIPLRTFSRTENDDEEKAEQEPFSTNLITTSTPKLPNVFGPVPSIPPRRRNSFGTPVRNFRIPFHRGKPNARGSPIPLRSVPITPLTRMKSPQDIVLEKLSELMKNASNGNRDNLEVIVEEIEKLNKELASMGIHIIDAEFDGHKIKLKDQVNTNRTGLNLSGATTIRYVIPNTNSRTRTRFLEPHIIKHSSSEETSSNVEGISPSEENQVKTKTQNGTTTTKPDASYFTLRHRNESGIVDQTSTLSSFPPSQNNETTLSLEPSSESIGITPTVLKPIVETERYESASKISATTTRTSYEPTRTRSTVISVENLNSTRNDKHSSTTTSPVNKRTNTNSTTPIENPTTTESTIVNPSAHLRPSVPKKDLPVLEEIPLKTETQNLSSTTSDESRKEIDHKLHEEEVDLNVIDNTDSTFPLLVSEYENILRNEISEETETETDQSYIYLIGILGIVPCMAALAILYRQRQKREMKSLPEREERAEGVTPPTNHTRPARHNDTLDAFPGYIFENAAKIGSPWELTRSKLRITSVIGEGNFGIVWKAEARNLYDWEEDGSPTMLVAVKGVKEGAGAKEKSDLLRELSIMQHLGQHTNIVTLLGCCTKHEPYYLVMEYVMFGKLLTFLREQRSKNNFFNFSSDSEHLTSRDLTKFACQIASGCEYLQSRGVIHRDLAARNILVDHNKICKIADFGLARSVKDMDNDIYEQKSKGPLPIRWMAPESLFMNIYTHKSDVWSFGILCWEIVTLGSTPYPGISAREVMRRVREGYRLDRPEHCRPEFYRIVTKCWHQDMTKRASFTTVKDELKTLLDNYSGWIDLENFQESTYYSMRQNNDEKL